MIGHTIAIHNGKEHFKRQDNGDSNYFPWKSIWKAKIPWHFFAWSAALGKILTIDNLQKMEGVNCELALYVQERWMVNQSFIITLPNG